MAKIPTALRQADDQAAALAAKRGMQGVPGQQPAPVATPVAAPQPTPTAGLDVVDPPPAAPAAPQPPAEPAVDPTLKARYDALQGKYNAEVPRLSQQLKDLQARLDQQDREKAELERKLAVAQEAPPDWAGDMNGLGESLGDTRLDKVLEGLRQENIELRQELRDRDNQIDGIMQRVEGVEQTSKREIETRLAHDEESFWRELKKAVPNFRTLNRDQHFREYMMEIDPYARRLGRTDQATRQQIMEERRANLDVQAVIAYYQEFTRQRETQGAERDFRLQSQISPDESGAGGTVLQGGKAIIPKSVVDQFYQDVRMGRYRGREKERAELDQQYFEAQRENRVDPRR